MSTLLLDSPSRAFKLDDLRNLAVKRTGKSLEEINADEQYIRENFRSVNERLRQHNLQMYQRYETAVVMIQLRQALYLS